MNTSPWAPTAYITPEIEGCRLVKTATHGGLMVLIEAGERLFSESARQLATKTDTHYCWEEDCAVWAPAYEMLVRHPLLARQLLFGGVMTQTDFNDRMNSALAALSRWNPDYLLALGLDPLPGPYQQWQDAQRYNEMLANKDPDLIVGTSNKKHDTICVMCADGSMCKVTLDSYQRVMQKGALRLLSECVQVDIDRP